MHAGGSASSPDFADHRDRFDADAAPRDRGTVPASPPVPAEPRAAPHGREDRGGAAGDAAAPAGRPGMNYTRALRRLCEWIIARLPMFAHVDLARVLIAYAQCRAGTRQGVFATMQPFRFEGGRRERLLGGRRWQWPPVRVRGVEQLYGLTVYLPRFQNLPYAEKFATLVHELYHISPAFDGDLRRFAGRNYAHGHSREAYDAALAPEAARLAGECPGEHRAWLTCNFAALEHAVGPLWGLAVRGLAPVSLGAADRPPVPADDPFAREFL